MSETQANVWSFLQSVGKYWIFWAILVAIVLVLLGKFTPADVLGWLHDAFAAIRGTG